jgi:hypothetical protein
MRPRLEYKTLSTKFTFKDVPSELVGTAWDPVMADGSPVQTASVDFAMPSDAEIRKRAKAIELAKRLSRPIQIKTFPVK